MEITLKAGMVLVEELSGPGVFKSLTCNDTRCNKARKNAKAKAYWIEYLKRNEKGDEIVLTRHKKKVINKIEEIRVAMMNLLQTGNIGWKAILPEI